MLRRYPDAIRTFVTILNFIMRMKQYHTRSYQYDQISKTADRMYALFAVCHALSPSRLDDNIGNIAKERFAEPYAKMSRGGEDALAAFEELFLYACPKFIAANPPPYDDPAALQNLLAPPSPADSEAADPTSHPDATHRHLQLFLSDAAAQSQVPTLRSFLKLYTSLGAKKLANFLDADEEEMVQEMMVVKQASRSISRVPGAENSGLLDGQTITTSDLNFVIAEVRLFSSRRLVYPHRMQLTTLPTEHGAHHRVDCWTSLCWMVHQEHGEDTEDLGRPQDYASSCIQGPCSTAAAAAAATTTTGKACWWRKEGRLGLS